MPTDRVPRTVHLGMSNDAALANAYEFIANNPRCTTSSVGAACPAYDWACSELERRNLVRRVTLRQGEQVEGRWATVASKVL